MTEETHEIDSKNEQGEKDANNEKDLKNEQECKDTSNEKDIKIIGINYKDNSQRTIKWLKELGNPYSNIAIDSNGQIGIDWGVY